MHRNRNLSLLILALSSGAGCQYVQDGWAFRPFEGPGYDIADGLLLDVEEGQTFLLATTYLPVSKAGERRFGDHMDALQDELDSGPEGLVGQSLAQKIFGREYRTLTVWEDEDAMMAFVLGEAHLAAMADSTEIADPESPIGPLVQRWEIAPEDLPPVWDEVIERLDTEGRGVIY